ncbi:ribonuclease P protein component [Cypionkella sp. TWP1-2-1b2]|uniref:ribonuclease P protein component n=1 Tax=Cypionkella sp. TWP1-2-1b2 TaxID=2804675 RepID=UPI003CF22593
MTPPKVSDIGPVAEASEAPPAIFARVQTMKNRPDYLRTAQGRRQGTGSFLLQGRARGDDTALVRIGFTASKKIGNAVARNRAKRRMRALAREVLPDLARPGWDYVLVAKPEATISRNYKDMLADFASALASVHKVRT